MFGQLKKWLLDLEGESPIWSKIGYTLAGLGIFLVIMISMI